MREIKFRAWDNLKKEWLKQKVYRSNITFNAEGIGEFGFKQHPEGYTIQQYVGLPDKNGKDIYEGDIVINAMDHWTPTMCVVGWSVYEDIGFAFYYPFKEPLEPLKQNFNGVDLYEEYPITYNRSPGYEVIGNIFENPELLQKLA